MSEHIRARFAAAVQHLHDQVCYIKGVDYNSNILTTARELIADLKKPRLNVVGDKFEPGEGWQKVQFLHSVGMSATGWRLVWEALRCAISGRQIAHTDKPLVVSFHMKANSEMYFGGAQAEETIH